jgi:hypothetical protein
MGPRQFKTCVYSSKPCDDNSGPGPPLAEKNVPRHYTINIAFVFFNIYHRSFMPWNCGGFILRQKNRHDHMPVFQLLQLDHIC